jgi:hypothetical protein
MAQQIKFGDKLLLKGETLILDNGSNHGVIKSNNGTVKIDGNLEVDGTIDRVSLQEILIADNMIVINSNHTGTPTVNGGIEVERGTETNVQFIWNETDDRWTTGAQTFHAGAIISPTFTGDLTGNSTGMHFGGLDTQGQDLISMGLSELNDVRIWFGSINDTTIGEFTPSTGVFTTLTATTINGPLTGTVSSIANHDTDDLAEGSTNLYYTQARVDARYATLHTDADAETLDGLDSLHFLNYNNLTNKLTAGTNVAISGSNVISSTDTNTTYTAGTGLTLVGTEFSNTAPDQTVALTGTGATTVTGTYPNFTIDSTNTTTSITGSIIPATDNTYDLGSSAKKYANIYGHSVEATFADLAERYATDVPYESGTVVVFGGEAEITTTTEPGDVSVAGVISTNPALKLNADAGNSQTHPYVALKGRVPCKLIGPVSKGDLIVTADNEPGYAQSIGKNDAGRSVFAKSIETDLTEGKRLIEVVIL